MPGMRCAVAICNNSYFKTKDRPDGVSYFRFPKDEKGRRIWVERCKRKDQFNPDTSYVCSDHFISTDFVRDIRAEIMGVSSKKKTLVKDAIPSVKLLPQESLKKVNRRDRLKERENKEMIQNIIQTSQNINENNSKCEQSEGPVDKSITEEVIDYKAEFLNMKEIFEKYKNEQTVKTMKLEQDFKNIQNDFTQNVSNKVHDILSGVFSNTQIKLLLNKKKKVKEWSCEDITKAFTIRYLSKRCYVHLRNKMGIPLPSLTTLKEWASKLSVHSGILENVLKIMEVAAVKMKNLEKFVVVQYDEMKVMSVFEYDSVNDKVVGPHSQAQVIMVRSLFSSWKQPVFTEFDQKMTRECLDAIISKLYAIGFTVVAVVSDCGGGNVGVWKEYNVTHDKSYHFSEITNRNIYFFADVPHLLKLIRNWYIDGGFVSDGKIISPDPVRKLVENTEHVEISSCYTLGPKHVNCEKFQRQNVRLAAQLMSNTTACALRRYNVCEEGLRNNAANFIKATNDWFDVMNSRVPNASLNLQCGYGLHLEEQQKTIHEYVKIVGEMACVEKTDTKESSISQGKEKKAEKSTKKTEKPKKKALKLFQKGVLMSSKSLIMLFEDLKKTNNISYILTSKLNQDSLENMFSLVRGSGGCNDNPTPMEFLYRTRLLILGKNQTMRSNCNTHQTDDEFIVGKVIKTVFKNPCVEEKNESVAKGDSDNEMDVDEMNPEETLNESTTNEHPGITSLAVPIGEKLTEDGLSYISGWMARKLKKKYPDLGNFTYKKNKTDGSWVSELSAGGLTEATLDFQSNILKMENVFHYFAGENIPNILGIKQKLIKKLKEVVSEVPDEIIALFARRRIAMRVKYLNKRRLSLQNVQKYKKLQKLAA